MTSAWLSLAALLVFGALAFGLRSFIQWRRTGSTGFRGISGRPGSAEWLGGVLVIVALVLAIAAPVSVLAGLATPWATPTGLWALGAALALAGITGTLLSQLSMGDSWRIGVDTQARTALVAAGPFRWVRNPIFSAMSIAAVGLALLAPNILSLLTVVVLAVALEVQVRLVEEPYLIHAHGERYRRYAATAGRFSTRARSPSNSDEAPARLRIGEDAASDGMPRSSAAQAPVSIGRMWPPTSGVGTATACETSSAATAGRPLHSAICARTASHSPRPNQSAVSVPSRLSGMPRLM